MTRVFGNERLNIGKKHFSVQPKIALRRRNRIWKRMAIAKLFLKLTNAETIRTASAKLFALHGNPKVQFT